MSIKNVAEIKKTDWSVAANSEVVGPKRTAIAVNNAAREVSASQAKASERAQSIIIGPEDGKAAEALQWLADERPDQITREVTSPEYRPSAAGSFLVNSELNRLSASAQTVLMPAQASMKLHELIMRQILLYS